MWCVECGDNDNGPKCLEKGVCVSRHVIWRGDSLRCNIPAQTSCGSVAAFINYNNFEFIYHEVQLKFIFFRGQGYTKKHFFIIHFTSSLLHNKILDFINCIKIIRLVIILLALNYFNRGNQYSDAVGLMRFKIQVSIRLFIILILE